MFQSFIPLCYAGGRSVLGLRLGGDGMVIDIIYSLSVYSFVIVMTDHLQDTYLYDTFKD